MKKVVLAAALVGILPLSAHCETNCETDFDGIYFGGGAMFGFSEDTTKLISNGADVSKNINRFMGTLLFGSGKTMNAYPLYFGGEILVDLGKTRREEFSFNNQYVVMKNNGIIPSFGFRAGYTKPKLDMLFFGKFAFTHTKSTMDYATGKVSVSKLVPTFAFGVEKSMCRKYTARFDFEYVMGSNKSNDTYKLERGHSINMRVTFAYNVKF